jgi:hypothetical protein
MNTAKPTAIYTITVGNIVERKGHRASCSQVVVELDVRSASEAEAVAIVKRAGAYENAIIAKRIRINPDAISERNITGQFHAGR